MDLKEGSKTFSNSTDSKIGVLVIHGYTGAPGSMLNQAKAFAELGFNVELPLLPGHGTDLADLSGTKYTQWTETVEKYYQKLKSKCDKVFLFGLSLGGALSLYLAERFDDVSGIILVNNALYMKGFQVKFLPVIKHFIKSVPGLSNDIKAPGVTEPSYDRNPTSTSHEAIKFLNIVKNDLYKVKCPALIFKSLEDHVIPLEVAEYTYEGIESADKKLIYLNDSYHVATLDNDAETISMVAINFIKERV